MTAWAELWSSAGRHGMDWPTLAGLLGHFLLLSMLSVGGAITAAPDMQRYLVVEQGWMTDAEFTASVAIGQAAPGPNLLFVALLGWQVAGVAGLLATMVGILVPSTLVAIAFGRYRQRRAGSLAMRAFTAGLAPLTLGLLLSTGWVLTAPAQAQPSQHLGTFALVALTLVLMLRSRISPLWLIALGAAVGAAGGA